MGFCKDCKWYRPPPQRGWGYEVLIRCSVMRPDYAAELDPVDGALPIVQRGRTLDEMREANKDYACEDFEPLETLAPVKDSSRPLALARASLGWGLVAGAAIAWALALIVASACIVSSPG